MIVIAKNIKSQRINSRFCTLISLVYTKGVL
jgi:hypothetical protein